MSNDSTVDDVRKVFDAQTARRWVVAQSTAEERIGKLTLLKDAIASHRDELADAVHADFRKHAAEFEFTDIYPVLEELNFAVKHLARWMEPVHAKSTLELIGTRSAVRYDALGLVLILAPWNYPFHLAFIPLIAAIAAGNCVVLKPSNKTANTAGVIEKLISSAFTQDEIAVITGDHRIADALLDLPFDHIFFTGSTAIGKKVMAAAARNLATVTLELGGKTPAIIDESADIDTSARRVMWGKCENAGQTCIAPDYALVHESVVDRFVEAAEKTVQSFYGPSPDDWVKNSDYPRMVDDSAFSRVSKLLQGSVAAGAQVAFGGASDAGERYIAPTLLAGVTPEMPVMSQEIFGPILPVLAFRNLDEAIALVRRGEKPLALYVFAEDRAVIERVLASTTSGGAVVNNVFLQIINPNVPFGGVGGSGQGNYHGEYGFRTFSHARAVVEQTMASAMSLLFPPYATKKSKVTQAVLERLVS
jgi:aldehyde dehydrogenase (NAD+)